MDFPMSTVIRGKHRFVYFKERKEKNKQTNWIFKEKEGKSVCVDEMLPAFCVLVRF